MSHGKRRTGNCVAAKVDHDRRVMSKRFLRVKAGKQPDYIRLR
jgi:hypothetical protein